MQTTTGIPVRLQRRNNMRSHFLFDSPVMNFLNKLTNLVILNLCFLFSCIPIVTIGAALTALYSVNLRMVKGEESYVFRSYWKAFKNNFRQATVCWAVMAFLFAILAADVYAIRLLEGGVRILFQTSAIIFSILYVILFLYVFPYIGWFDDRLKICFKNAFLIGGSNIAYTITILLVTAAVVLCSVYNAEIMLRVLILWILFGAALLNYIQSFFMRRVFMKYESSGE